MGHLSPPGGVRPYAGAASTAQGFKTTVQRATATSTLSFDQIDSQSPVNPADFTASTISATDTTRPIFYEYNLAVSQRLKFNSLVEVAYVGSAGRHLSTYNSEGGGYNEASDQNLIPRDISSILLRQTS